jgi:probable FeS assembly SUF system protein SufT
MSHKTLKLISNCEATLIPSGEAVVIPPAAELELVQALGGSITVRWQGVLYRLDASQASSFDPESAQAFHFSSPSESKLSQEPFSETTLWNALKTCFDPEIPINIVDLGLIYDLQSETLPNGKNAVKVAMTLTAQGCGMGPILAEDARRKLEAIAEVESAQVQILWDPPWTPHMISRAGRQQLGME